MIVGYTTGVFDLFHVGHVHLLQNAKSLCDKLIVGVSTDDLVGYKGKKSVIPFEERLQIVAANKYVDLVVPQEKIDKIEAYKKFKFNVLIVGDDWYDKPTWKHYEEELAKHNVRVFYMPYTKSTSSTMINETLLSLRGE
jgi:glycerol-3-phosphate cytidylyltransferase|tara:strand:- start:2466 stop:2882 length:417 start_codon:yes stop_codon:yes gene_type:complete